MKEIEGVETRVLWDQTFHDATLVESELTFQAQDEEGNVWVLGTFPVETEDNELIEKKKLDPTDRINADLAALALDKLGFQINDIYQQTEPLELGSGNDEENPVWLRGDQTLKQALKQ